MRFLLTAVNAKYIHSNPAVYSLQAYACQEDPTLKEQIFVAEYTINQQMEDVLADLYEHRPDLSEKAGCNLLFLLYLEYSVY